jgi:PAS domain S-box-containing protein
MTRTLGACRFRRVDTREAYLAALAERCPDVIVSDFRLPAFDGLTALRLAQERCPDVPFIVLTGSTNEDTAVACMKAGAWDYVIKEHSKRLGPAVLAAVEQRRMREEQRRADAALKESEARLKEAQRLGRIGHWQYRVDTGKLVWSEMVYAIYGRDPQLGAPAWEEEATFYSPDDARLLHDCARAVLDTGRRFEVDVTLRASPERPVEVVVIGAPLRDPAGKVIGLEGTIQDITERKRAVRELELRNVLLATQQEASLDGILVIDTGRQVLSCNRRFVELWGLPRASVEGGPAARVLEAMAAALVQPQPFRDELSWLEAHPLEKSHAEMVLRDGRTLERDSAPMIAPEGAHHGRVWFFTDVTSSKRAEADRERLAAALEQAAEMFVVTDARGTIQYVNPAFVTATGYSRAEALGQNPRFLKSGKQDEQTYRDLWATLESGRTWKGRLVNRKRDGTLYTQESTISPVRDAAGAITAYVGVLKDITRELSLEAQFLMAQRMEGIGRLAGGVAHDFNNLLSVILSCSSFALESLPEGPVREELVEIQRAGERAVTLTRQLLAFSRRQLLKPEALDLNRVLTEMEKLLQRLLGEDVELKKVLSPDLWPVKADPGQVEQVLVNLVANARDAMPGGGTLTIETANVEVDATGVAHVAVKPGRYVMVAVSDTGLGMDEHTLSQIFEPFFTTKGPGKGTGLGLSTVYGIIKQSGGNIWVYSELGKGTTFKVYLPREESAAQAPVAPEPHTTGTETILLVEDDQSVRSIASRILRAAGYAVLTAASGPEALLLVAAHPAPIDLVLTDVVMPQMSGRAFISRFSQARPAAKVLYMSGYTDNTIAHQGVTAPGTNFIGKPFTQAGLVKKVREVLDAGAAADQSPPALASGAADPAAPRRALTKESLQALPASVTQQLARAARAARQDEMIALLERLHREYPEAAWQLRQMVDAFDQDGILDVL